MVSLDEIKRIQNERKNIKKVIYKRIYDEFSRKIKKAVDIGHEQIILKTPNYIWGLPSYDVFKATVYLKRQFDHSGFTTYMFSEDELYISWAQQKKGVVSDTGDRSTRVSRGGIVSVTGDRSTEPEEEDFPKFVNLKKMANKLRKH